MSGTVLGAGNTTLRKHTKISAFFEFTLQWGESANKQNNYIDDILLLERRKSPKIACREYEIEKIPQILKCAT